MSLSTLNRGHQIQQTAAAFGRIEVSTGESFPRSSNHYYINALIEEDVTKKIIKTIRFALETLSTQRRISSVVVQFWAATKCSKKVHLLTTTSQPFGFLGNNEELQEYRIACLNHKLYAYKDVEKKEGKAVGLSSHAFLKHAFQHTQNVHDHPKDQRPPCRDAIFERTWGSYDVPVINFAGTCFGVLQFITDTPKENFDEDILAVSNALKHAGLQFSFPYNPPDELKMITGQKRKRTPKTLKKRKTMTSDVTDYRSLVPHMGLIKKVAAEKLARDSAEKKLENAIALEKLGQATFAKKLRQAAAKQKTIIESTFGNVRDKVGLPEWPWVRNSTTSATKTQMHQIACGTSSCETPSSNLTSVTSDGFPETQTNQTVSDTSSCVTPSADSTSFPGDGLSELSCVQETGNDQIAFGINPDFKPECGEMNFQNNGLVLEYPGSNDFEEMFNFDYVNNADLMDEEKSVTTNDVEALVACPEKEHQGNNASIMEDTHIMDDYHNFDVDEWINECFI